MVFFPAVQLCTFCAFFCALKRISKHEQKHKKRTTEIYYGSRKFLQQHPWPCLQPSNRRRSGPAGLLAVKEKGLVGVGGGWGAVVEAGRDAGLGREWLGSGFLIEMEAM